MPILGEVRKARVPIDAHPKGSSTIPIKAASTRQWHSEAGADMPAATVDGIGRRLLRQRDVRELLRHA
jgi:hypothetical protein